MWATDETTWNYLILNSTTNTPQWPPIPNDDCSGKTENGWDDFLDEMFLLCLCLLPNRIPILMFWSLKPTHTKLYMAKLRSRDCGSRKYSWCPNFFESVQMNIVTYISEKADLEDFVNCVPLKNGYQSKEGELVSHKVSLDLRINLIPVYHL